MTKTLSKDELTVHTRPTVYTVSCLPTDDIDACSWDVTVTYRGRDLWAVTNRGFLTLNDAREWDVDPGCRNMDDDWLATHRFTLSKALELAQAAAPGVTVNGMTPGEWLAIRQRHAAEAGEAR